MEDFLHKDQVRCQVIEVKPENLQKQKFFCEALFGKSFHQRSGLLGRGDPRWEFHDLQVAKVDFGPFRLKTKVTLLVLNVSDAIDELAVNRKFSDPVHADDVVHVPLSPALASVLEGLAATTTRVVGSRLETTRSKELAVDVSDGRRNFALAGVQFDPFEFEHLDLQALGQPVAERDGVAPSKNAGITSGFHVPPLHMEQKVLVLLLASHNPDGLALADQYALLDVPRIGRSVDVDPPGEILAVEQINPLWNLGRLSN
tara:strand:+ start:3406 stop:4179 length:774 start_codon:yes stop_codon:yes gene_type:complete